MEKAEEKLETQMEIIEELERRHAERRRKIFFAVFAIVSFLVIGTVFYHINEKWSIIDSVFFSTIILTTIGLGNLSPTNDLSKIFTIGYAFMGVGTVLYLLTSIASYILEEREKGFSLRMKDIKNMELHKKAGHLGKHFFEKMKYSKKDLK